MRRINYYLFLLLSTILMVSCNEEPKTPERQEIGISLELQSELFGIEFREDTLFTPKDGAKNINFYINNSENMSLNTVDFKYSVLNNNDDSNDWFKIKMNGCEMEVSVLAFKKSSKKFRSADIRLEGVSEKYDIKPIEFTIYQYNHKLNRECWIESFSVPGESRKADIYYDRYVVIHMPYGSDISNLTPTIVVSKNATCEPKSGVPQDFRHDIIYTITAENGECNKFTALVEMDKEPKHECEILSFSINGIVDEAVIGENAIDAIVATGTDITSMKPITTLSEGATVSPKNGDVVDFTDPVKFTVTAEDGIKTRTYTVNVVEGGICSIKGDGNPADGIVITDGRYNIPVEGSQASNMKIELTRNGKEVSDLGRYEFNIGTVDMKSHSSADWISVTAAQNGRFSFSVAANPNESIRRAQIVVDVKDTQNKEVYAKGILHINQSGKGEVTELVEMVFVKGGRFLQGDSKDAGFKADSVRWVNLSDFYIGKYEITQSQFEAVMGVNPSGFKKDGANCPVETITIWDAMEFCDRLSEREGYSTFYNLEAKMYVKNNIAYAERHCDMNATGYRLPTLAEWEYAAKGGEEQINTKLYSFAGCDEADINEYAWYGANNGERPQTVGTKLPNSLGIYDMSGNVSEWVHDFRYDRYIGLFPSTDEVFDPFGPEEPFDKEIHVFSQGGYYATYEYNLNVIKHSMQCADNGLIDGSHMCLPEAFGMRIAIRK